MESASRRYHPILSILLTIVFVFAGFNLIGPFIGFFIAAPFYDGTMAEMFAVLQHPTDDPGIRTTLMILQACGTFFGLIVVPWTLLRKQGVPLSDFFSQRLYLQPVILIVFIIVMFIIADSVIAVWNQNIDFPDWMSGFEKWARASEDTMTELTKFVTQFDSFGAMVLGLLVIAILPAIGEEIVFRGLIQNDLFRATRNIHVAIWTSAIIFSAFHLQFFGFFPRMLLGALFGYMYYWSGSLLMPVIAHFINNGLIVVSLYLYQRGVITVDMESNEAAPWSAVISSTVMLGLLIYFYRKFYAENPPAHPLEQPRQTDGW
ncbi:MAG TPA: CPBP family intramembrane glutamic endopeptidase [Ohtaekwangia sp.]|nr:CPBP family intramembrane glutamic endopeptidase [Ohtaekwangia sp.]